MGVRAPNGARPILVAGAGRRRGPPPFSVLDLEIGGGGSATAARSFWPEGSLRILPSDMARALNGRNRLSDRSLNLHLKGGAVSHALCVTSSRARGPPLGQRFRSGGAGAELWGLFGASRSKPLTEGWLWRVCALAFQAG